jgi:hypothetical protein
MPHTVLECQVCKMFNSDTRPRPTTNLWREVLRGAAHRPGTVWAELSEPEVDQADLQ